jgi:hypothetical protein
MSVVRATLTSIDGCAPNKAGRSTISSDFRHKGTHPLPNGQNAVWVEWMDLTDRNGPLR